MTALITRIADWIGAWANDQASPVIVKNWGFVELVNREVKGKTKTSVQPIPVTINGTPDRQQVSLNDKEDFIFWIRVPGRIGQVKSDEDSWGLKEGKRQSIGMRIVIAHKVELGEDLVSNLLQDMPSVFYVQGFEFVFIDSNSEIDFDHETIHDTELGKTNYEKHRFPWNMYVINLNVEFVPCTDFVTPDFLTDEFGNFLTS